jgi:hypothetical protein
MSEIGELTEVEAARAEPPPPEAALAVWGAPSPAVKGQRVALKVGVGCACGCDLARACLVLRDGAGALIASAIAENLRSDPDELYWADVAFDAPGEVGVVQYRVSVDWAEVETPHAAADMAFTLRVAPPPEHRVIVRAVYGETGAPIANAEIGLDAYLARTNEAGEARFDVPPGAYTCTLRKFGFKLAPIPVLVNESMMLDLDVEKGETREELERRLSMMENVPWG